MHTRRQLLQTISAGAGGLAMAPLLRYLQTHADGDDAQLPKRFVFVLRANGLRPYGVQPQGLEELVERKTRPDGHVEHKLEGRKLHPSMAALEPFKKKLNIIQGLSGRMCSGAHGAHYGALGAFRMGEHDPAPAATLDAILIEKYPGIFPYLGVKMDQPGKLVAYSRLSAFGRNKPMSLYSDPMLAYKDLFGTILKDGDLKKEFDVDKNLLDYLAADIKRTRRKLNAEEKEKLDHYLHGYEALRDRQAKLSKLDLAPGKGAPVLNDKFKSAVETQRLEAHFDLVACALISGLTNVATVDADALELHYTGLGLGEHSLHSIGHLAEARDPKKYKPFSNGVTGVQARERIRKFQMDLIGGLARKLEAVPEGDGTMLDNTLIVFLSPSAEAHHPGYHNWPIVTLGNCGKKLKTGRYIQFAKYGERGHRTIGNFHTAILHAAGLPRPHFGQLDLQLGADFDQKGPLRELFG